MAYKAPMGFLRRLFGRRPDLAPIAEEEAYARSYGDRGGDLIRVSRVVAEPVPVAAVAQPPISGDLTGELLRRAFETRLDRRTHSAHR
jgi:hypothetical protein